MTKQDIIKYYLIYLTVPDSKCCAGTVVAHLVCSASVVSELHLDITLLSDEYCMLNMLVSDIQQ